MTIYKKMHMNSQPKESFHVFMNFCLLIISEQTRYFFILFSGIKVGGFKNPRYDVKIAQTSRRFFDIRFECIGRFLETQMPLLLLDEFGSEEVNKIQLDFHPFGVFLV